MSSNPPEKTRVEKMKEYKKQWRKRNRLKLNEYHKNYVKKWRLSNLDKVKEYRKTSKQRETVEEKNKRLIYQREYRAKRMSNPVLKARYNQQLKEYRKRVKEKSKKE